MIVAMPVYMAHHLTQQAVTSLAGTVLGPLTLVIVDNGSPDPYLPGQFDAPFRLRVVRNYHNQGNFIPLRQVAELEPDHDIVAMVHNDLIVYEAGWDRRVTDAFRDDPQLGAVGFVGSPGVVDSPDTSYRDVTMSHFRGPRGHASAEQIGIRVTGQRPVSLLDGVFMAFRREALDALTLDASLPPAHYFDLIWSAQVQLAGWRAAMIGIDCDHVGWGTEIGQAAALQTEWARWCTEHGLDPGSDPMAVIRAYGKVHWDTLRGSFWPRSEPMGWA